MGVIELTAIGLLVILGRLVFAYFSPYRECRWCRPGGLLRRDPPKRKRKRYCWRCKGTRLTRRWGAWHAHKIRDSLQRSWEDQ